MDEHRIADHGTVRFLNVGAGPVAVLIVFVDENSPLHPHGGAGHVIPAVGVLGIFADFLRGHLALGVISIQADAVARVVILVAAPGAVSIVGLRPEGQAFPGLVDRIGCPGRQTAHFILLFPELPPLLIVAVIDDAVRRDLSVCIHGGGPQQLALFAVVVQIGRAVLIQPDLRAAHGAEDILQRMRGFLRFFAGRRHIPVGLCVPFPDGSGRFRCSAAKCQNQKQDEQKQPFFHQHSLLPSPEWPEYIFSISQIMIHA